MLWSNHTIQVCQMITILHEEDCGSHRLSFSYVFDQSLNRSVLHFQLRMLFVPTPYFLSLSISLSAVSAVYVSSPLVIVSPIMFSFAVFGKTFRVWTNCGLRWQKHTCFKASDNYFRCFNIVRTSLLLRLNARWAASKSRMENKIEWSGSLTHIVSDGSTYAVTFFQQHFYCIFDSNSVLELCILHSWNGLCVCS